MNTSNTYRHITFTSLTLCLFFMKRRMFTSLSYTGIYVKRFTESQVQTSRWLSPRG